MERTILITNVAAHYRQEIFERLSGIGVDFAFSDEPTTISSINYEELKSDVKFFRLFSAGAGICFMPKAVVECFKYKNIIITGDFRSLHVWLILIIAIFEGKHVYLWGHAWYGREGRLKKFLKSLFFKPAYKILTYGNYAKNLMVEEGYAPEKIVPIYNSLSYEKQLLEREKLILERQKKPNTDRRSLYVVFVGRLTQRKRLTLVLDALKKISVEKELYIDFVLIGPELDNGELRVYSQKMDMQNCVKFIGPVYDESLLSKYLYDASVCVSPGHVGLAAIHSLSFGTPVITHDNFINQAPEFEAIIPDKTGFFFEENSVDSLAESIYKIVNVTDSEREQIRKDCFDEIDRVWNTRYQMNVFKNILE